MHAHVEPTTGHWDERLEHVVLSDVGLRRSNNQDSLAVMMAANAEQWATRGHLFLVADGMGAHAAGELASKLAADNIPHTYFKLVSQPAPAAIVKSIKEVNSHIYNRGRANPDFHGMGTTTSALVLLPQGAIVAHVGDSRVYRLRSNQVLEQLSFDHSLAWELLARGKVSESQVALQVPKNIITRSLGPTPEVDVDIEGPFPVQAGDTFLLCSDGLSGQVADDEMGLIMQSLPPAEAARALVDLANLRGGPDNITLIIIKVNKPLIGPNSQEPLPPLSVGSPNAPPPPIPTPGWIMLGIGVAVVLLLFILGQKLIGLLVLLGVIGGATFLFRNHILPTTETRPLQGGRYGRGPYRQYNCTAYGEFIARLATLTRELKEAATSEDWSVDWFEFNRHCEEAQRATADKQTGQAIREYCLAMSFMMNELRNQRRKK